MLDVQISNEQSSLDFDAERMRSTVETILRDAGVEQAEVSLAIVDDATMHSLNREYLEHDYPTDVLSFLLERDETSLEGEVIASGDYAIRSAAEYGWSADDELLLYVIHGTLHLVGYDDLAPEPQAIMRAQERLYLERMGLEPRY